MSRKRADGMGLIRERSDGRWEARYTVGYDMNAFCGGQRPVVRLSSGRYLKGPSASMVKANAGAYAPH